MRTAHQAQGRRPSVVNRAAEVIARHPHGEKDAGRIADALNEAGLLTREEDDEDDV